MLIALALQSVYVDTRKLLVDSITRFWHHKDIRQSDYLQQSLAPVLLRETSPDNCSSQPSAQDDPELR